MLKFTFTRQNEESIVTEHLNALAVVEFARSAYGAGLPWGTIELNLSDSGRCVLIPDGLNYACVIERI